jgi:curved DNA-binding protein CbpA
VQGSLSQDLLPEVIRKLYLGRKTGILHLAHSGVSKRIYFKKGSMIFANSDVNDDRLGEFLIRAGRIKRADFEMASKVMKETKQRFGKTLVEMGHIPADDMLGLVVEQIEAIIYSLFKWEAGDYRFEEKDNPVDEDIMLNLSSADIILEGIRRIEDPAVIRRCLGDTRGILRHSDNPLLLYQKISLNPSEGFVLSRVDGVSSVEEIASISPLGDEATFRCVYGLVSAGVLEIEVRRVTAPPRAAPEPLEIPKPEAETLSRDKPKVEAPAGPSPEEQAIRDDIIAKHAALAQASYYELLGLTRAASDGEVKKAYYAVAKKYHPDRHHSPYLQDIHGLLEELFMKITEAYELLSNPLERRRYDSNLRNEAPRGEAGFGGPTLPSGPARPDPNEKMAEIRYREGKRHFTEMHFFDAIQSLREAVKLAPNKAPYHRLLAQALVKNPHWRKEAEEHFQKAVDIDHFDTESFAGLAEIYEAAGMSTRAQKMWQAVLDSDPQNELAKEKLFGKKKPSAVEGLKGLLRRKKE